ncbi:hypothetical protein [Mumia sp. DW29H23]|uniref:hypothetical protein n=1 Tax=Mumia sp. DW29H23 TaxID=3421241 RepID=UPI003D680CA8
MTLSTKIALALLGVLVAVVGGTAAFAALGSATPAPDETQPVRISPAATPTTVPSSGATPPTPAPTPTRPTDDDDDDDDFEQQRPTPRDVDDDSDDGSDDDGGDDDGDDHGRDDD